MMRQKKYYVELELKLSDISQNYNFWINVYFYLMNLTFVVS